MKSARLFSLLFLMLLGLSGSVDAQNNSRKPPAPTGGLLTLYKLDPVLSGYCFTENHAGHVMNDHRVLNEGSELDFGIYHAGSFSVADSNGATGRIVDLGTSRTLGDEYGYNETVGEGQGFASIHRKDTSFFVRQRHGVDGGSEYRELTEGKRLLADLKPLDSAPVVLGHLYILHVTQTEGPTKGDVFVKLMVVAYQPDQSVTIRWEIMASE